MLAVALWIAATVAMFLFDTKSRWFWLSDFLLIAGFCPLLFYWRPSWPWFGFGVCNIVIAIELLVLPFVPLSKLPSWLVPTSRHIIEHHSFVPWFLLGVLSIIYGTIRAIKNLVLWLGVKR